MERLESIDQPPHFSQLPRRSASQGRPARSCPDLAIGRERHELVEPGESTVLSEHKLPRLHGCGCSRIGLLADRSLTAHHHWLKSREDDQHAKSVYQNPVARSQRLLEVDYCSWAYSALACGRIGTSGSASFHKSKKSWNAFLAFAASPASAEARAIPK